MALAPDGDATRSLGGDVLLAGLTLDQARTLILERVPERLKDPELNIVLKNFRTPCVMVRDEVQTPVRLELSAANQRLSY